MKIGELAKATRTAVDTIRFYERESLLPAAARTEGNYRIYDASHVERLTFIRHCRSLDMGLDEIRTLLRFKDAPDSGCGAVAVLLDAHIGHVAERMQELRSLQKRLKALRQLCREEAAASDCAILKKLSDTDVPPDVPPARLHVHGVH
jgi:Cd(II)/Pb(II)-responsive transcriptional regulator